ncbi:DUF3558 domain-containing protein [Saccharopolyspora gloriosae]|uniref:DUF3558 domain-containing protein n=1 Tax=Saccharopolyspora gloriosae TaxID=455344 RepID=UPI001FB7C70C|nr:DUF3558 domain-containing protein [Saccharopolyspora gloriosae]
MITASLLALTAASACSVGESGGGQQPAPPASDAVDPALKVESPKNLAGVSDSCQLLTAEQLSALGASGSEPKPSINDQYKEPTCNISNDAFDITVDINTKNGGMTAANARRDNFDNFAPTEVAGYPAAQINADSSVCTVAAGIADDQSIEVFYAKNAGGTPEMDDACGYAKKITAEVIKNIPSA